MAEIPGTRFGTLAFQEDELLTFPRGLVGLPNLTQFVLIEHRPESPFRWLQSVEEPALAFLVTDPTRYVENYAPLLSDSDARALGLEATTPTVILATATIPAGNPNGLTLNLAGPMIINAETRVGAQVVIDDSSVPTKFQPFRQETVAA